ncbi:hypothetical protein HDV00_012101 [Rhizophlyctis rosea]|nr:hypothetical protein HDV00_012101 [Rhizophlyctis rosea]
MFTVPFNPQGCRRSLQERNANADSWLPQSKPTIRFVGVPGNMLSDPVNSVKSRLVPPHLRTTVDSVRVLKPTTAPYRFDVVVDTTQHADEIIFTQHWQHDRKTAANKTARRVRAGLLDVRPDRSSIFHFTAGQIQYASAEELLEAERKECKKNRTPKIEITDITRAGLEVVWNLVDTHNLVSTDRAPCLPKYGQTA